MKCHTRPNKLNPAMPNRHEDERKNRVDMVFLVQIKNFETHLLGT